MRSSRTWVSEKLAEIIRIEKPNTVGEFRERAARKRHLCAGDQVSVNMWDRMVAEWICKFEGLKEFYAEAEAK